MKTIKRFGMAMIPFIIIILVLSGCKSNDYYDEDGNVDINKMLLSMSSKSVKDLGLPEQPTSIEDVPGGYIDVALLGTWLSADGTWLYRQHFTFNDNGEFDMNDAGLPDVYFGRRYTCLVSKGLKLLCCEYPQSDTESVYTYYAYTVKNDALYMTYLEKTGKSASYFSRVFCLYKTDENWDNSTAVKNNPVSLSSLYGDWEVDGTAVKIDSDGLKVGNSTYNIHLSNNARLVVEKDESSSEYLYYLYHNKTYTDETKTELIGEDMSLKLYHLRKDNDDKPNLLEEIPGWIDNWGYEITLARPK